MKTIVFRIVLVCLGLSVQSTVGASVLQNAIDKASRGAVIELTQGVYEGPIVISKPLTIRSSEANAIVRGNGSGSVITVLSPHVTISGLVIEHSGDEHQSIDSGVSVKDSFNVSIRDNTIRDCLFGVNLEKTNQSAVERNTISSKPYSLGLRGDGIRLWYSHSNTIRENKTSRVRDNVFWYSSANRFEENTGTDSRYSLHFMYADRNMVFRNDFRRNSVGIFMMFCQGSVVKNNLIASSDGPFGIGIGLKDASDIFIENNEVLYNARGFYLDSSPNQPGTENVFRNNNIHFNSIAFHLHATLLGSRFENNNFQGNIEDVSNDTPDSRLELNRWHENYWDAFRGFDRDRDGIGDIAHEQWLYADRIWSHVPAARIFYASPVLDFLNFLWRMMPFSEPSLVARDARPRMREVHN